MRWWERVGSWDDTRRFVVDAVGAGLLALVLVPLSASLGAPAPAGWFVLAMCVALAWRRTAPAASAAAVYTVGLLHLVSVVVLGAGTDSSGPVVLPPGDGLVLGDGLVFVALYSVTVHGPVWAYRTALAGALTGTALVAATVAAQGDLGAGAVVAVMTGMTSLAVFSFALVRRSRRETIDALVDRASRLEVERDQQARIATAAERSRIAREMHDIVAHSLSVIIAQADGGRYVAQADPEAAGRSLTTIAETGRAALTDMRRLLGVLRTGEEDPAATTAPSPADRSAPAPPVDLAPQPAVADVEGLVEQVRGSGVNVSLVRMGAARALPPGTGLTVYRICQESLTNILKHAGPAPTATVLLQWNAASLVLEVSDDGRGAAAEDDGVGQGVLGMRERAAMLGGSVTVGPRPGGGYRVRAEIPIPRVEPAQA